MAAPGNHGEPAGASDMAEHLRTWKLFTALIRWTLAGCGLLLVLLLAFRTHG